MARVRLPGGLGSLESPLEGGFVKKRPPDFDHGNAAKKAKMQARKERQAVAAAARQSAAAAAANFQKGAKGGGKVKGGGKGKDGLHSVDQGRVQICFSWANGQGACGALPPNSTCPLGRAHKCQICLSTAHRSGGCPSAPG
eukprot:12694374-Heterocapsa_arctica.AAC.1